PAGRGIDSAPRQNAPSNIEEGLAGSARTALVALASAAPPCRRQTACRRGFVGRRGGRGPCRGTRSGGAMDQQAADPCRCTVRRLVLVRCLSSCPKRI